MTILSFFSTNPPKLSEDEKQLILFLYLKKEMTSSAIASLIDRNTSTVSRFLARAGVFVPGKNVVSNLPNIVFTDEEIQRLEGELLGDGSLFLQKRGKTPEFCHTTIHQGYTEYLRASIGFLFNARVYQQPSRAMVRNGKTYHCKPTYTISSGSNLGLISHHERWYVNRRKVVPSDLTLSPLTCLHWFLGDGYSSVSKYSFSVSLSTNGFSSDEVYFLSERLNSLGFKNHVNQYLKPKTFGSGLVIRFSTYSTPDFLDYIGLPPIPELAYRWNLNS